jgi:hypothetical protein
MRRRFFDEVPVGPGKISDDSKLEAMDSSIGGQRQ